VVLLLAGPVRAEVKDPADLFPAEALAYLEFREPGPLAKEIAALVKGSVLENLPASIAKFREEHPTNQFWMFQSIGMSGIFASPEFIAELGRLQGAAVAMTGFTKDHEPEIAGFVLAGTSHAPTFIVRMYLTVEEVRIVGEEGGIQLFQERSLPVRGGLGARIDPIAPEAKDHGPTFALLPDGVVIGSSIQSVKDVIRRYQGKASAAALSSVAGFQDAAKLRGPGLFAYADCARLVAAFDGLDPKALPLTDYEWRAFKAFVNPKALRSLAAGLTLRNGDLELNTQLNLEPKERSPVLHFLAEQPADPSLLHAVPAGSLAAVTLRFPDGAKAWNQAVQLADALAQIEGKPENLWPSKALEELEKRLKVRFGPNLLAKVSGLALAFDLKGDVAPGGTPLPLVVIRATDDAAAESLEQMAPHLLGLLSRQEIGAPTREKVEGRAVYSLSGEGLPWRTPLYYGRLGAVLVFGQSQKSIVEALQGVEKKQGMLGQPKVAEAIRKYEAPIAVGAGSLREVLLQTLDWKGAEPPGAPAAPAPQPKPAGPDLNSQFAKALTELMDPLPPGTIALLRKPESLTLEIRQAQLRSASAKVIDFVVRWALEGIAGQTRKAN
jgi:hypothetical protein